MDTSTISLSDIASVTKGNEGMFGGSGMWIFALLILLLIGGGNGGLFGGNRYADSAFGNYATSASQQEILFGQQFSNLDNKIDRIGYGICDSTYALNNAISTGVNSLGGQIADLRYATQHNIDSVRYDMSNFASAINSNIDNKFAHLERTQLEQTIAKQSEQINQLQLAQAMCGIPKISTFAWGTYPYNNMGCCCGNGNI